MKWKHIMALHNCWSAVHKVTENCKKGKFDQDCFRLPLIIVLELFCRLKKWRAPCYRCFPESAGGVEVRCPVFKKMQNDGKCCFLLGFFAENLYPAIIQTDMFLCQFEVS